MADYSMVGAFNSGGSSSLNGELIQKLRDAEAKSKIDPIDTQLESWDKEVEKITEIKEKIVAFANIAKHFDITNADNVFNQILTKTTGDSVVFDAIDTSTLSEGTTTISVSQLAQKDVYQTSTFTDASATIATGQGATDNISIAIGTGTAIEFTTQGKTYTQLAEEINNTEGIEASVEKISDTESRIVIKSSDTGTANALTIVETGVDLDTDVAANHTLTAQNLNAKVDGVDYDVSSNTIKLQGSLSFTAVKENTGSETSSITITKDSSAALSAVELLVNEYNSLNTMINDELSSDDTPIQDKSTLRSMLSDIKNMFFKQYGADTPAWGSAKDDDGNTLYEHSNVTNNDKNIFSYGISLDKTGQLSVDTEEFTEALSDNLEDLKSLFVGAYENKGLGTQLYEYLDALDGYEGILTTYSENMDENKKELEADKEKETKALDEKYDRMAAQFSAYSAVIAQMEASFGGLKMMIEQSTASK
jgi:flagellar hook-associated protein 2